MNDFELMWPYVKSLAEKLMLSDENLLSEDIYNQYVLAFDQLMTIADNNPDYVDDYVLEDIRYIVFCLEKRYADMQIVLTEKIKNERIREKLNSSYSGKFNLGYDKEV